MQPTDHSTAHKDAIPTTSGVTVQERATIIEQERNRIARDLHDSVVQQIVVVRQKLELIQHYLEQGQQQQIQRELVHISAMLDESLEELRTSILSLTPARLDQHTLSEALNALLNEHRRNNPQQKIIQHLPALPLVPPHIAGTLFRLFQEALSNIHKHAHASKLYLSLEQDKESLSLEIRDNGNGFLPTQTPSPTQFGLYTMRTRVQEIGGKWELQSHPGLGTTIKITIPYIMNEQI
jgi:NarL family two-component system sensor histidine kinase LiaS